MKSHPILFSAPMVRAILDGRKTQTRRIVKPNEAVSFDDGGLLSFLPCPYGQPGDQLWVREAFADLTVSHGQSWERFNKESRLYERGRHPFVWYRADGDQPDVGGGDLNPERWRPSIHMPRWASRITLENISVRVERLQDISEADAIAEGAKHNGECDHIRHSCAEIGCFGPNSYRGGYAELWDQINGAGSWAANPWVWAIEFKRVNQ